jgi:hypothetical protein
VHACMHAFMCQIDGRSLCVVCLWRKQQCVLHAVVADGDCGQPVFRVPLLTYVHDGTLCMMDVWHSVYGTHCVWYTVFRVHSTAHCSIPSVPSISIMRVTTRQRKHKSCKDTTPIQARLGDLEVEALGS